MIGIRPAIRVPAFARSRLGQRKGVIALGLIIVFAACTALLPIRIEFLDPTQPFHDSTATEITANHRIGQTFVGAADGLDRIDVWVEDATCRDPARVSLTLFDVTTFERLARSDAPCVSVSHGAYLSLPFQRIEPSGGRQFRIALELVDPPPETSLALGGMNWDVYSEGLLSLDGQRRAGSIAFRTHYDSSVLSVYLARLTANKPGIWGWGGLYVLLALAWIGCAGGLIALAWRATAAQPTDVERTGEGSRGRAAASLGRPFSILSPRSWLRDRLRAFLMVLALVQGLTYVAIVPPWNVPDEPQHFSYIRALLLGSPPATTYTEAPSVEQDILESMTRHRWFQINHMTPPTDQPRGFYDLPFFRLSTTPRGHQPPTYYILSALLIRLTSGGSTVEGQLYAVRLLGVLMGVAVVMLAYLTVRVLCGSNRLLLLTIPSIVAQVPQRAFIAAGANNDNLAILASSVVFLICVQALVGGMSRGRLLGSSVASLLAILSKATTLAVTAGVGVVAVRSGVGAIARRWSRLAAIVTAAAGLVLILGTLWRGFVPCDSLYWTSNAPTACSRVAMNDEPGSSDGYALRVRDDSPSTRVVLYQNLPPDLVRELRGNVVTFGAWVRAPSGKNDAYFQLDEGVAIETVTFDATSEWQFAARAVRIPSNASALAIWLGATDGQVEATGEALYRGVVLVEGDWTSAGPPRSVDDRTVSWNGRQLANAFANGSGQVPVYQPVPALAVLFRALGVNPPVVAVEVLTDPRTYQPASLQAYRTYTSVLLNSFWGEFGWMNLPLSPTWYNLLQVLTIVSVVGAIRSSIRQYAAAGQEPDRSAELVARAVFLSLFVVVFEFCTVFLREVPRFGQSQGRYALPVVVPFAIVLWFGLSELCPKLVRPWLALALLTLLIVLNYASLVLVIVTRSYVPGA